MLRDRYLQRENMRVYFRGTIRNSTKYCLPYNPLTVEEYGNIKNAIYTETVSHIGLVRKLTFLT